MQQDDEPAQAGTPRAWSGRFAEPLDRLAQRFNASVSFDRRLAPFDIAGSLAHARMLARCKVITAEDLAAIERGLGQIREEVEAGRFPWSIDREETDTKRQNCREAFRQIFLATV